MAKKYELLYVLNGTLPADELRVQMDRVRAIVEASAEIVQVTEWGRRRLAYEINKKHEGFYLVLEVLAEPGALDRMENNLRLADEVVRHKLIRLPDHEAAKRGLFGEQAVPAEAG